MVNKSSLIFLTLTAALDLVLASSVQITSPKANAVYEAGSTVDIKWHVNDKSAGPIRLQYASGKASSLNIDGVIADNVDASLGIYKWKIPKDIKPKKYVLEAGPNAKDLSFQGYITIKKASKHTKTTTKKTAKKTTKKTTTKKTKTTKRGTASAICIGYPSEQDRGEYVRCHSIPKAIAASHKKKKHTTTKKHTVVKKKKTTKKTTKKPKKAVTA